MYILTTDNFFLDNRNCWKKQMYKNIKCRKDKDKGKSFFSLLTIINYSKIQ